MEDIVLVWVVVGFLFLFSFRNFLLRFLQRSAFNASYDKELHDVLNKDEFRVKGRFE